MDWGDESDTDLAYVISTALAMGQRVWVGIPSESGARCVSGSHMQAL